MFPPQIHQARTYIYLQKNQLIVYPRCSTVFKFQIICFKNIIPTSAIFSKPTKETFKLDYIGKDQIKS